MPPEDPDTNSNDRLEPVQHQPLNISDMYPAKKSHKKRNLIIAFVVIAILAGTVTYVLVLSKPAPKATPVAQENANSESGTPDTPNATDTKPYENGFLGVKLSYPSNWTATESGNKDSLRLESPNLSIQTLEKGTVNGNFRIYIRKGARLGDGKYIGRGYAMQPSEKLTYTNPSADQRPDTFLTLFGLDKPDNFGYFLIAGNYNLAKGDTLGPDYGKEPETYIITGGFSGKELTDDLATYSVSPDTLNSSNAYTQAKDILKSLQLR